MSNKKTAIITGATGTIGRAITRSMAEKGYQIIFTARSREKAKLLSAELNISGFKSGIEYCICDLGNKEEIKQMASGINQPIDVLINNAATTPKVRSLTKQNIEMQWAVNVLGYYWMIKYFTPHLVKSSHPRIVNVASYWAGHLDLSDPEFSKRTYDNNTAYMQSKQSNRMLSKAFSERLKESNIIVNSCHPGDANSKLSNDLGFGGHETAEKAAETPVFLATSVDLENTTGKYFQNKKEAACRFSQNHEEVEKLFLLCEKY